MKDIQFEAEYLECIYGLLYVIFNYDESSTMYLLGLKFLGIREIEDAFEKTIFRPWPRVSGRTFLVHEEGRDGKSITFLPVNPHHLNARGYQSLVKGLAQSGPWKQVVLHG